METRPESRSMKRQEARDAKNLEEPSEDLDRVQVRSYLEATGCRLGLLINFNVPVLLRGVRRIIVTA